MKTWTEAKNDFVKDHLSKPLKAPNTRLRALGNIETSLRGNNKNLLEGSTIFIKYDELSFRDFYRKLKDNPLNSAEKSVIHGLYKFSV